MTILCTISARGGSRGLPNKNIKPLLGKPLIVWTIEQALTTPEIDRVVVSTDSEVIAEVARSVGAETPFMRPKHLATSEAGKWDTFKHALDACEKYYDETYEVYVDLDCTNPLREVKDISSCITQFRTRREYGVDGVFSVCNARKNPYFNMLELNHIGALKISKELPETIVRRQAAPIVFEHVASIYALAPEYVRRVDYLLDGVTEGYDIGVEKSFDIDSELDFSIIEFLMKK